MTDFASLTNQIAVVTGSSSGIGRAIALEFARAGADIVIHCARSIDAAHELALEIESLGRSAKVVQADFRGGPLFDDFVDRAWSAFGQVDIWVNNAGADVLTGPAADWSYERKLSELFDVDVRAGMLIAKAAGQKMFEQRRGAILMIGWDQADRGMEGNSGELFAASKNAVMGFSRSLALSLAPHVRVNCISPGWIKTAWGEIASDAWHQRVIKETPLHRWGLPEDIANAARFLCSDAASFVTGQVFNVNGGAVR
ncbi:SDR family NAD(P)-dependent oxidoreductase [Schlesneria paludicola]|uniref:SDR family NAD(P)-dependent oxidoreductase n=1 Tax=Schlesneria paludicola TaxID=360056 RepID=UPI00029A36F8|nr:SDR family oxidoreductase [Schlesneria paludicola]